MNGERGGATPAVLPFATAAEREASLPAVLEHLRADGVIAYPTETVYGLGCLLRAPALERLSRLKRRTPDKPFLLLVRAADELPAVRWTDAARRLADAFWPGPLTLALAAESSHLPPEVLGPDGAVAVRATPHDGVRALLAALGEPITSTSANAPGAPPAASAAQAVAAVRELGASEVLVLDGGTLPPSPPSTLVLCAGARPRVARAGAVDLDALRHVVPEIHG